MALNLTSEGLKYPPEVRVRHETCSTICGTHVQAILDQKNLTGLAGGSGKVKIMHLCTFPIEMTKMCHILTFPGPSCRPGQIFLVQNGLYRCPTYSTTCFMSNSHLWGGIFGPLKSDLGVFWPFRGTDFIMGKKPKCKFLKTL